MNETVRFFILFQLFNLIIISNNNINWFAVPGPQDIEFGKDSYWFKIS